MASTTDIRLDITIFSNPKVLRLQKRLGSDGVVALIRLWCYTGASKPDGDLGTDVETIEVAAGWTGEDGKLVDTLASLKLLDVGDDGSFLVHGWDENQPYIADAPSRSEQARKAALARHERKSKSKASARSMPPANKQHAPAVPPPSLPPTLLPTIPPPPTPQASPARQREDRPMSQAVGDVLERIKAKLPAELDNGEQPTAGGEGAHAPTSNGNGGNGNGARGEPDKLTASRIAGLQNLSKFVLQKILDEHWPLIKSLRVRVNGSGDIPIATAYDRWRDTGSHAYRDALIMAFVTTVPPAPQAAAAGRG
jgi:hypothetical protein